MKNLLIIISLLLAGCTAVSPAAKAPEQGTDHISQVCFGEACFTVEIADTGAERALGLMHREYLAPERGMLFIFEGNSAYTFWMKNTLIPLDIIWLDEDKHVVYISEDTPPCKSDPCPSYGPSEPTRYVVEINSGAAKTSNIAVGSQALFQ